MSYKVEDLEQKNMKKLTIEVSADEFEKAMEKAYLANRGKVAIQGFRKGKAPRALIERMYGAGVFYEDAANSLIPDAYEKAADESGLDIVSRPEIDVEQIETGKDFIFTAAVAVKPEITLKRYKGIEVEKEDLFVSEDEINEELNKVREQNSRTITIEDRPVASGDTAVIDFKGFCDGEAFEGGAGENHELVIGSHSFIDTFEDQLIGKSIGEEVDVNVTFPEEYGAKELAGKPALFKVKVNAIKCKELPELDDEFASEASEFDTLDEYKKSIQATILEKKEKEAKAKKEDAVVDKIIEETEMDIPAAMLDTQKRQMADEFNQRLQMQGLNMEQYMKFTGMTANKFMESLEPQALKRIQYRLILEAVVKAENIEVTDAELEEEFNKMAETYKMEVEKVKELIGEKEREQMKMDLAVTKAIDFIAGAAVEK